MEEVDVKNVKCVVCGGENFYKDSGFYFCNECQTQTQEIVERVFEEFDEKQEHKVSRKIGKKPSVEQNKLKLTTWECYNYILKGLTEELVVLGAGELLRLVVKKLWMKYLLKIQVVNLDKPKLQAVNTKIDAEIVYGKRSKRKRKKRPSRASFVSDSDLSSLDPASLKRERAKRRRALVKAQYDQSLLSQSVDNSLLNETLTSLKSSDGSSRTSVPLRYNKYAKRELRKTQSDRHLKEHMEDFDSSMRCHKNTYKEVTKKYVNSPHVLSINKIYSILYLGLLLTKSKVQLGDMLRFIREGHLSFNSFKHFFPDDLKENSLTNMFPRKYSLMSDNLRRVAYQIGKFLGVLKYLDVQNLAHLIDRYCIELNLPCAIKERVLSMLLVTLPEMNLKGRMWAVPNYEARALSLIIFQLKLLFGLDGKTEKHLSRIREDNFFNFSDWMQYLDYRNKVLQRCFFPLYFLENKSFENSGEFVKFMISKNADYCQLEPDRKYEKSVNDIKNLLTKLKMKQENVEEPTSFTPSLTPLRDYTNKIVKDQKVSRVELEILKRNFEYSSIHFLVQDSDNFDLQDVAKGANDNIKMFKLINNEYDNSKRLKDGRKFHMFKVENCEDDDSSITSSVNSSIRVEEVEKYLKKFDKIHQNEKTEICSDSSIRYQPQKRFWVNSHFNLGRLPKEEFDNHFASYPRNFQFLIRQLAKVVEQSPQDILSEYSLTEIYLLYHETFESGDNMNIESLFYETLMKSLVRKAKNNW